MFSLGLWDAPVFHRLREVLYGCLGALRQGLIIRGALAQGATYRIIQQLRRTKLFFRRVQSERVLRSTLRLQGLPCVLLIQKFDGDQMTEKYLGLPGEKLKIRSERWSLRSFALIQNPRSAPRSRGEVDVKNVILNFRFCKGLVCSWMS